MAYTTIKKPSEYFDTKIYTGNGTSQTLDIDNLGLLWMKNRTEISNHNLFDVVRGGYYTSDPGPNLRTNNTTEGHGSDITSAYGITFGSSSSTIGSDGGGYNYNQSGKSYVAWQWSAGTTSGITTDGNTTITPSNYSFNQTSGFSIISYTGNGVEGAKLAHGLGTTPAMVIIKRYSTTGDWVVYHKNLTATNSVFLNYSQGQASRSPNGYIYSPDDTNITLSNHGDVNSNGVTTVAYCFADVQGFSKFGSYTGNGSSDGPFVYTGFKPAFILVKNSSSSAEWEIYDNKRAGYNPANYHLNAHDSSAEATLDNRFDLLSNGWKVRTAPSGPINTSGNTYIYMAFAEEPLVGDNPATAR